MSEALLILRKDVRRLRWEICVLAALVACLSVFDSQFESNARRGGAFTLLEVVVSLSAWFVVALAILEEKLAGERAYWLTRPIRRKSLLIAKLLFIASFVVLPTLLAQTATLLWHGQSPWAYRSDLLASHFLLAASLLVIAVVASVVTNMSAFVSALLGAIAIAVFGALGMGWVLNWLSRRSHAWSGPPVDISSASYFVVCLVGIAATAILIFHYAHRRTAAARISLIALAVFQGAAILFVLGGSKFLGRIIPALESPSPDGQTTLSFDPTREPPPAKTSPNFIGQLHIPIRTEGLPPGVLLAGEIIDYRIQSSGEFDYGETSHWVSGDALSGHWLDAIPNGDAWLRLNANNSDTTGLCSVFMRDCALSSWMSVPWKRPCPRRPPA